MRVAVLQFPGPIAIGIQNMRSKMSLEFLQKECAKIGYLQEPGGDCSRRFSFGDYLRCDNRPFFSNHE